MKTLAQQMAIYAAYHRDPRNRITHFVGVPLIMFSLLLALGWIRFSVAGMEMSAAVLIAVVVLGYYFALDALLALAMTVCMGLLWWAAELVIGLSFDWSLTVFVIAFVGGWILQLVGHGFEGRRPALMDNLFQIFVAPIFLMAEVFFMFGFRAQLRKQVWGK